MYAPFQHLPVSLLRLKLRSYLSLPMNIPSYSAISMNATILTTPFNTPGVASFPRFKRQTTNTTVTFDWFYNPWFVSGMSLLIVAIIISLITLGFCLGRRYCCKAPSVVLNAGSPLPFWHRAWNTMGVYRPCGGHRCATSHHYCSRFHC